MYLFVRPDISARRRRRRVLSKTNPISLLRFCGVRLYRIELLLFADYWKD